MKKFLYNIQFSVFIFSLLALLAISCTQANSPILATATIEPQVQPTQLANLTKPTSTQVPSNVAQTNIHDLIPMQTFNDGSPSILCSQTVNLKDTGGLSQSCANGKLTFSAQPDREKSSKYLLLTQPIPATRSLVLEVNLASIAGQKGKPDQNQYGFNIAEDDDHGYILRFKGQFFRLEKYLIMHDSLNPQGEMHITNWWNWTFAPQMKSVNSNSIKLTCSGQVCDLAINDGLVGRMHLDQPFAAASIGIYAKVDHGSVFGQVEVANLHAYEPSSETAGPTPYTLSDTLRSDKGTFQKESGAYNFYDTDGFHFESIVPYGFYGIKTGPGLQNVSVSATVMINPQYSSSTLFAGLVCRSSSEGMYIAAIRDDTTFLVYRDSPNRPFTLLARGYSKWIKTGGSENKLRLDCVGNTISFYINDQLVETLQDSQYNLIFGRSGLFTKASKTPNENAIIYSNLNVSEIQ